MVHRVALSCMVLGIGLSALEASEDRQLERLIARLEQENPRLAEHRARSSEARARAERVLALPDPHISYRRYLSTPETRVGPQRQSVEISQELPRPSLRRLAGRESRNEAEAHDLETRAEYLRLVAELKVEYFEIAFVGEALASAAEERAMLERFEKSALDRYSAGEGIQQSVIRIQTDLTRLADRTLALSRELESRTYRIAELVGETDHDPVIRPAALAPPPPATSLPPDSASRQSNPLLEAARLRIAARETAVDRGKRDARPRLGVGLGWTDVGGRRDFAPPPDNGKDVWSVRIGVSAPIFRGRVRAEVDEREAAADAERFRLEQVRRRLATSLRDARSALRTLEERSRLYEEVLIPQAEQSLGSAEAAYRTGRASVLDLLEAQRVLFAVRLTARRLVADQWIAWARLERDLGTER